MRHPGVTWLTRSAEILPWHLWHRLPGSCSFISASQLTIKAPSHFLISVFCSVRQDLALGILFLVYLSLQQAEMKETARSLANGKATTSLQRSAFSLDSLTPSPFTTFCSFLAWVFIPPGGWSRALFFFFHFRIVLGSLPKKLPTWEPFITDRELLAPELPLKHAGNIVVWRLKIRLESQL